VDRGLSPAQRLEEFRRLFGENADELGELSNLAQEFARNGIRPPIWDFHGPRPNARPMFS
jgi:hypothetical protein